MSRSATGKIEAAAKLELEGIIEDYAALKRDFAKLIEHIDTGATNGAGDATNALQNSIAQLGERLGGKTKAAYNSLAAQGQKSAEALGRQIEERPVLSLLVAFGVGMLTSKLLSR